MKTFGAILRKSDQKCNENYWGFHSKWMTFRDLAQVNLSLGKSALWTMEKRCCENLINTVVYEDLWGHFPKSDEKYQENHWFFTPN